MNKRNELRAKLHACHIQQQQQQQQTRSGGPSAVNQIPKAKRPAAVAAISATVPKKTKLEHRFHHKQQHHHQLGHLLNQQNQNQQPIASSSSPSATSFSSSANALEQQRQQQQQQQSLLLVREAAECAASAVDDAAGEVVVEESGGGGRGQLGEFAHVNVQLELGYGIRIDGRFSRMTRRSFMTAYHLVCDYADAELGPAGQKFLRIYRFRISMPPKDEKKWGTRLASAAYIGMLSLLTGRAVRTNWCVTGALDGDGTVNSVAGIPQKVAAAVENAQQFIVMPETNFRDFQRIDLDRRPIEARFAQNVNDLLQMLI
ncbi:hypothetical protein niasHS_012660 [Heterodera schachtii]|uniref:Lon proteolytic domain-containing protein n=1 Tax=Heterodera schachtii TaxID=97005 RepID=A0ABD2IM36_HETSC